MFCKKKTSRPERKTKKEHKQKKINNGEKKTTKQNKTKANKQTNKKTNQEKKKQQKLFYLGVSLLYLEEKWGVYTYIISKIARQKLEASGTLFPHIFL